QNGFGCIHGGFQYLKTPPCGLLHRFCEVDRTFFQSLGSSPGRLFADTPDYFSPFAKHFTEFFGLLSERASGSRSRVRERFGGVEHASGEELTGVRCELLRFEAHSHRPGWWRRRRFERRCQHPSNEDAPNDGNTRGEKRVLLYPLAHFHGSLVNVELFDFFPQLTDGIGKLSTCPLEGFGHLASLIFDLF